MNFTVNQLSELETIAENITALCKSNAVFCFYGEMGTGKTTLIKLICERLGVTDGISSPTYPIINEYNCPDGKIYHMDLYRLKSVDEALNIGLEDYLYSGSLCFVEWPDNFESLIPDKHIKIILRKLEEHSRTIEVIS
jgi:tRNA threonylcarbamoyladenosine biosynthesis protein TsaE